MDYDPTLPYPRETISYKYMGDFHFVSMSSDSYGSNVRKFVTEDTEDSDTEVPEVTEVAEDTEDAEDADFPEVTEHVYRPLRRSARIKCGSFTPY